jgi:hypothetical protein
MNSIILVIRQNKFSLSINLQRKIKLKVNMKKANLLSRAEMKKVMGGVFEPESIDGGGGGKCKGICIAEGNSCPTEHGTILSVPPEVCPPRYPKCCEY